MFLKFGEERTIYYSWVSLIQVWLAVKTSFGVVLRANASLFFLEGKFDQYPIHF